MHGILQHERFAETFRRLAGVTLNPRRHTAANALEHSEAVAARAAALARANGCTEREVGLLEDLGRAHDIGKVTGTARPERSLEVLRDCGVDDPALLALVKWHDTSLPWYLAQAKGQPPSDKAWRRLAAEVDLRLLSLFMVADRVDAPPGWRRNAPTAWFLGEARARGLVSGLVLDLPDHPSEICAGGAVVRGEPGARELLVIRVRAEGYELPKGGIEWDELPEAAAARETREEAGVTSPLEAARELPHVDYFVGGGAGEGADAGGSAGEEAGRYRKRVRYFVLGVLGVPGVPGDAAGVELGPLPARTRERRWIGPGELAALPLVNDDLRPLLAAALA